MRILADENIPNVEQFFGRFGQVTTLPGRDIVSEHVAEVDILIVRSVTKVNRALLEGSPVKFVGTCTIGTDHLDLMYLSENNIAYSSAPGCNAGGVVQYDLASLYSLDSNWTQLKIGVIGCGNVGSRLCRAFTQLEVDLCVYDPFLGENDEFPLAPLEEVLECDVICMHTPYTTSGPYPTHHMIGEQQLEQIKEGAILLNAGRGGAIDNEALLRCLQNGKDLKVVLDVWEHEPFINVNLLNYVALGSPHIAGYSYEGKLLGSFMIFEALVNFINVDRDAHIEYGKNLLQLLQGDVQRISPRNIEEAVLSTYPVGVDDARFRQALNKLNPNDVGRVFDLLRKEYPQRREFGHFNYNGECKNVHQTLLKLGFV